MDNIIKPMTQDEIVIELINLLKQNQMTDKANDLFETADYIDSLQGKLDQVMEELVTVKKQLSEIQENKENRELNNVLKSMSNRMAIHCYHLTNQLFEVKSDIVVKAHKLIEGVKLQGMNALNNFNEFIGIKKRLENIRLRVHGCVEDSDRMIAKLDSLGAGFRDAAHDLANSLRTFADKEVVDYSEMEKKISKTELLKKPWVTKKTLFESMAIRLDAAIDKVDNLARDVELSRGEEVKNDISEIILNKDTEINVTEGSEYRYGSEIFESQDNKNSVKLIGINNIYSNSNSKKQR
jgi:hypothetical protein